MIMRHCGTGGTAMSMSLIWRNNSRNIQTYRIGYTDRAGCGTYGPVAIYLKNETEKIVDYNGIEGKLSI